MKRLYLTDELIILIKNKMEKYINEQIFYTNNPTKFIAEYSQTL